MAERDLPEVATPWTDPLGNVWCVLARGRDPVLYKLTTITTHQHPSLSTESDEWLEATWFAPAANAAMLHPDLLAGLGRTLPPVPTPKRVAKAFKVQNPTLPEEHRKEYAASDNVLYYRFPGERRWEKSPPIDNSYHIAAAHMAFQHAGDVLPGEEASDA